MEIYIFLENFIKGTILGLKLCYSSGKFAISPEVLILGLYQLSSCKYIHKLDLYFNHSARCRFFGLRCVFIGFLAYYLK